MIKKKIFYDLSNMDFILYGITLPHIKAKGDSMPKNKKKVKK